MTTLHRMSLIIKFLRWGDKEIYTIPPQMAYNYLIYIFLIGRLKSYYFL